MTTPIPSHPPLLDLQPATESACKAPVAFALRTRAIASGLTALSLLVSAPVSLAQEALRDGETRTSLRGPDGLDYPDWRYAGVPGGIPEVPTVADVADFGGVPGDDKDDSAAVTKAIAAAAERGGGAVLLGAGVWHLDHAVEIQTDGIVIRGAGREKTRIESRFRTFEPGAVELVHPAAGEALRNNNILEVLFDPAGMLSVRVTVDGKEVAKRGSDRGRNVEYWLRTSGQRVIEVLRQAGVEPGGTHTLTVSVERRKDASAGGDAVESRASGRWVENAQGLREWKDAAGETETTTSTFEVQVDPSGADEFRSALAKEAPSLFSFFGKRAAGTLRVAEDAKRGDLSVLLAEDPVGIAPGDVVEISVPYNERFKKEIISTVPKNWGTRQMQVVVQAVEGRRVHLNQPLRIDFPLVDEPVLRRTLPIRNCGVEGLTLVQTVPRLVHSFMFAQAYGCWMRDVNVEKTGRNPVMFAQSKFCEVRDLGANDAWFGVRDNMGGGTAYGSFDTVWDTLMDGGVFRGLRHAPNLQNSAFGNVMRRLDTVGSDVQWHAFLSAEKLVENVKASSITGKGGTYGYGAYASGPDSSVHGPQLQRNVLYGCDLESSETGFMHLGGPSATGWIAAYNRFLVRDQGVALNVQLGIPDFTFIGNVCQSPNPTGIYGVPTYRNPNGAKKFFNEAEGAAVWINPVDSFGANKPEYEPLTVTGLKILNNKFYGFKTVYAGKEGEVTERGNELLEPLPEGDPAPPTPLVPSIYLWQKANYPLAAGKWPTHPEAAKIP